MPHAGIIGSGNIGSAVAARLLAAGYTVAMANSRGPASLGAQAARLGIEPVTLAEAAAAPDLVLLAVPEYAVALIGAEPFTATPAGAMVIDAGNYYPGLRDGAIAAIDAGLTDSEWVAQTIGRPVLKLFNTIHAARIAEDHRPAGDGARICLPVAGDDPAAKARAIALADAMGFDALDAGSLAQSWRQQPGTPVYCTHLPLAECRLALAAARREDGAAQREAALARARDWQAAGAEIGRWSPPAST